MSSELSSAGPSSAELSRAGLSSTELSSAELSSTEPSETTTLALNESADATALIKWDAQGLCVAIAQDFDTGEIRMVAWISADALKATLTSGKVTFFSRSRQQLWTKGETSGHHLLVKEVHLDCDGDTVLMRVVPQGPSCHTGRPTCFFRRLEAGAWQESAAPAATFLETLEREIAMREESTGEKSYTKHLLERGVPKIAEKVLEEASEFGDALKNETGDRVANEAADVLYHLMVGLRARSVAWHKVMEVLSARSGQSGHTEKASRSQ
jgi:phosphoribosyl-ATP pyrophosphohydrolase/phosphoribosyl-AMP cyclohydrolase